MRIVTDWSTLICASAARTKLLAQVLSQEARHAAFDAEAIAAAALGSEAAIDDLKSKMLHSIAAVTGALEADPLPPPAARPGSSPATLPEPQANEVDGESKEARVSETEAGGDPSALVAWDAASLHVIAGRGDFTAAAALVADFCSSGRSGDIDERNGFGATPLHFACLQARVCQKSPCDPPRRRPSPLYHFGSFCASGPH